MTSDLIMELKGRITVYSTEGCNYCRRAKNILSEKGLPFTDVNLDSHPYLQEYVTSKTGKAAVPQIFFNDICVGGYDALLEKFSNEHEYNLLLDEVTNNEIPPDGPKVPNQESAVWSTFMDFTRKPDEYVKVVTDLKKSALIKEHDGPGSLTHQNSFNGQDFVEWVITTKNVERDAAIDMGQRLVSQHFCHKIAGSSVDFEAGDALYRLFEDENTNALNGGEMSQHLPRKATVVAEDMRRTILKLYSSFLSSDGKAVDYDGIGKSPEFQDYTALAKELVRVDVESLTREEKLAFFINIYNALVIHGTIKFGHPSDPCQIDRFFGTMKYLIGGLLYSLDDIENGVLRANSKGAGKHIKPFGDKDPRIKMALTEREPLVHFALVCGAKSCPPIKTYSPESIMDQLKLAAQAFLEDDYSLSVDLANRKVIISQIFEWYRVDFGGNDKEVLEFIYSHLGDSDKKKKLGELLKIGQYTTYYHPYDWSINSKH